MKKKQELDLPLNLPTKTDTVYQQKVVFHDNQLKISLVDTALDLKKRYLEGLVHVSNDDVHKLTQLRTGLNIGKVSLVDCRLEEKDLSALEELIKKHNK